MQRLLASNPYFHRAAGQHPAPWHGCPPGRVAPWTWPTLGCSSQAPAGALLVDMSSDLAL